MSARVGWMTGRGVRGSGYNLSSYSGAGLLAGRVAGLSFGQLGSRSAIGISATRGIATLRCFEQRSRHVDMQRVVRSSVLTTLPSFQYSTRNFSSSRSSLYRRNPTEWIPTPVKALALVGGTAAGLLFISVPIIIIFGPPLALGLWWYLRRIRALTQQMHHERWNNMANFHLMFEEPQGPLFESSNLAQRQIGESDRVARTRVLDAIHNNEQGLARHLAVTDPGDLDALEFTPVQSIQQDFRASSEGFQEKMEIRTFGLVSRLTSQTLANVTISIYSNGRNHSKKMQVEVRTPDGSTFVLDAPDDADTIIEIKR